MDKYFTEISECLRGHAASVAGSELKLHLFPEPTLFRWDLEPEMVGRIRKTTNGHYALGSERFAEEVALMLARRVTPGKSGRPRKPEVGRNESLF